MTLGIILAFIALFGFGSSSILARLGLQQLRPATAALISITTGFLLTAFLAAIFHIQELFSLPPLAYLWALLYGLVTFNLARLVLYFAFSQAGASRVSPIISSSPIFATILAMLALNERPNLLIWLGILITVSGMALILSERQKSAG